MRFLISLCVLLLSSTEFCASKSGATTRLVVTGAYNKFYELKVNSSSEITIEFDNNTSIFPARVTTICNSATRKNPLLVVAQQRKLITSWQLPHISDSVFLRTGYQLTSHTLCPDTISFFQNESTRFIQRHLPAEQCSNPVITVRTSNEKDISFGLRVDIQTDFFVTAGVDHVVAVSETEPVYFYYSFYDPANMANNSDAVLVTASSDTLTCMLFSIQNSTCPVYDAENNIKFDSYYQTMSKKAAMVVTKRHFPHGFFIVLVVKSKDDDCQSTQENTFIQNRKKDVTIHVAPTLSLREHNMYAHITISVFFIIFLIAAILGIWYFVRTYKNAKKQLNITEAEGETLVDGRKLHWMQFCFFNCRDPSQSATNYVWLVIIVILFYILPVLQVTSTYQGIVNETGNDDICYYNFLCALPNNFIIHMTDFNHVLSNIGYIFLGIVFLILTYLRGVRERSRQRVGYGLPKPYGMYYALGLALVMEGIMSACYHICPKKSNFQFDTSFMYIMTVLMIVNVYESRRRDRDVERRDMRGYVVFFSLAGATALSVIGSYVGDKSTFWIIFTILHILACVIITWLLEGTFLMSIFGKTSCCKIGWTDACHAVLLFLINGVNIALATLGVVFKYSFATHLLMVLIANGVMYTMFYISMKVLYKEKIVAETYVLIVLALLCWVPALYFFMSAASTWEETPAGSRNKNQECLLINYYDTHDIWHFLSAFALFFTCWILLSLDEGLDDVKTVDIVDFHGEPRR